MFGNPRDAFFDSTLFRGGGGAGSLKGKLSFFAGCSGIAFVKKPRWVFLGVPFALSPSPSLSFSRLLSWEKMKPAWAGP